MIDKRNFALALLTIPLVGACRADEPGARAVVAPSLTRSIEEAEIAQLETNRMDGDGALQSYLEHPEPAVRWRAATALGRLPFPDFGAEVTTPLLRTLADEDESVRAAAVFALGMRRDPSAGDRIVGFATEEPLAPVRALAVEATSKLDRPDLHPAVLEFLDDPAEDVRREALIAPHRWPVDLPNAGAVDERILGHASRPENDGLLADAVFTLQRRRSEAARTLFLSNADSERTQVRLFAVRGLARTSNIPAVREVLQQATRDPDWRIAAEATIGLGNYPVAETATALLGATRNESAHVRRLAFESAVAALADVELSLDSAIQALAAQAARSAKEDASPAVRRAAATAHMRFEFARNGQIPQGLLVRDETGRVEDPLLAVALARGMIGLSGGDTAPWLLRLADDKRPLVRSAAFEALGPHDREDVRERLLRGLRDEDNGVRLAAVNALAEHVRPAEVEAIASAFETTRGDVAIEVRFQALRTVAPLRTPEVELLLRSGLAASQRFVRRTAELQLAEFFPETDLRQLEIEAAAKRRRSAPVPDIDFPLYETNPRVRIETTRGIMVFELFPNEAPTHVYNFLTRAAAGYYDSLPFHRVVPDFVIQGGDYRGDGNGGTTWRGEKDSLGHEIGPRRYVRGSLGMPRYDDWDSGGSQIFVTHRRTPHLDGRYTIFGELRLGDDVLDSIEVGDRILAVEAIPWP